MLRGARGNPALARQLDWSKRLGMALDAAKGMLYLHSHRPLIIHRDLKSPNLLVDKHWRVKVTDFNLSRAADAPSTTNSSVTANNPRWSAPEVRGGVWAVGGRGGGGVRVWVLASMAGRPLRPILGSSAAALCASAAPAPGHHPCAMRN